MQLKTVFIAVILCLVPVFAYKPVVLIHGVMTGSASMEVIKLRIQEKHPGTIVYNIHRFESWSSLETMWHQVMEIGMDIANISASHPEGINLIGYSQGGLIARGIVETFSNLSVSTFISLSSPQAGQYGAGFLHLVFPGLVKDTVWQLFYSNVGQHTSVGNYWNDPYHQKLYETYSVYLPYINNEKISPKSDDFKANMLRLKRLVLIGGPSDQVITPWQSRCGVTWLRQGMLKQNLAQAFCTRWIKISVLVSRHGPYTDGSYVYQFGYYDSNETVIELHEQDIYKEDRIGLKTLDKTGRLHIVTVPGVNHFNWHMNVSIVDDCLLPYLD